MGMIVMVTCEAEDCRWHKGDGCIRQGIRIVEGDNREPVCDGYQQKEDEE